MAEEKSGFSLDEVLQLLNKMNESADERMLRAIQEIKKPTAEEQAKLDKEHAKLKERAATAVKLAMAEEQGKKNAARSCPHGTTHKGTHVFTHQFRAQIHTPAGEKPFYMPRCTQCGSTWDRVYGLRSPKIVATNEQLGNPIDMCDWSMDDIKRMVEWVRVNPDFNPVEELAIA